jgi:hypothetical protein
MVKINERDLKEGESKFPSLTTFGTFLLIYRGVQDSVGSISLA